MYCKNPCLVKLLVDTVSDELLEADIITHLKQILTATDAVSELLCNSLMLVKSLSAVGQFITSHQTLLIIPAL